VQRVFFAQVDRDPTLEARVFDVMERRQSPFDMAPVFRVLWSTLVAAVQGRPQVIGELLAAARRTVPMYLEWRAMRRLLGEADASAARVESTPPSD
jgi:hypothetical protein